MSHGDIPNLNELNWKFAIGDMVSHKSGGVYRIESYFIFEAFLQPCYLYSDGLIPWGRTKEDMESEGRFKKIEI